MHLLLVEDDAALGEVVCRGLQAAGFRVDWAKDGEAAFDRAAEGVYDVMVLDLMLPGIGGLELLRELRQTGIRTPVLCLTARGTIQDRVDGLDAGADDYLVKPFAFAELQARLRALLRRPADAIRPEALVAGNLRLSAQAHSVVVQGRQIEVPLREFDVLEYLLRNAGQVLTRDQIIARVWGSEAEPRANVAEATVSRLRRRLAAAGWVGAIVAVSGVGYRLAAPERGEAKRR